MCGLDADAAQRLRALQVLQGATGSGRVEVDLQSDWKFFEVRNLEPEVARMLKFPFLLNKCCWIKSMYG